MLNVKHRKFCRKCRSFAELAFDKQSALMMRKNMLDDCKSEAGPVLLTTCFRIDTVEPFR